MSLKHVVRSSLLLLAVPLLVSPLQASGTAAATDPRLDLLHALKTELTRSKERLRLPGEDGPYFIRYLVREYDDYDMFARFGALLEDSHQHVRQANVEVRVGSYKFDNTADDSAEKAFDMDDFDRYEPPVVAPIDDNADALRATLWLQTDARYKQALALLHKKRGARVTKMVEDESMLSFSREKPQRAVDKPLTLKLDRAAWGNRLRKISALFKAYPEIFDSQVKLTVDHQTRFLVTTEGTELVNERLIYGLHLTANARAADGLLINHFKSFYGASESEMPDDATLERTAKQLAEEVQQLRLAPMMDPFNGPAILLPEAAGVF
ncbi:MAG TPA: TldD/PmbA family protein, partial [Polyangia bacterium]